MFERKGLEKGKRRKWCVRVERKKQTKAEKRERKWWKMEKGKKKRRKTFKKRKMENFLKIFIYVELIN